MGFENPSFGKKVEKNVLENPELNTADLKRELYELEARANEKYKEYEALVNKSYGMQPHLKGVETQSDRPITQETVRDLKEGRKITEQMAGDKKAEYEETARKIRELYDKLNTSPLDRKL